MPAKPKKGAKPLCLCGCKEPAYIRGLAVACYHATRRLVAKGKVTWEWLEETGNALPAVDGKNRGRRNPHADKILKLAKSRG